MIKFNEDDFNLIKIKRQSKLSNLFTKNKYRIYGLRQLDNPCILIECHYSGISDDILDSLELFFDNNKINTEWFTEGPRNEISIGIRKDLRSVLNKNGKPVLASSILSTIIYALEGRIDYYQLVKYKIKNGFPFSN